MQTAPDWKTKEINRKSEQGFGLVIVIIILAFLLGMGIVMLSLTGTGTQIAGNIRTQDQAFNAAEAGFDLAWISIEENFLNGIWANFTDHYLKDPTGIDLPYAVNYFRKLTDLEIFDQLDPNGDGTADVTNVLYFKEPYIKDAGGQYNMRYTYTVFLIDDEAAGGTSDATDVLMVCIGAVGYGTELTTSRIEVLLATELPGS